MFYGYLESLYRDMDISSLILGASVGPVSGRCTKVLGEPNKASGSAWNKDGLKPLEDPTRPNFHVNPHIKVNILMVTLW